MHSDNVLGVDGGKIMDPEFKWFISESEWESICRYGGTPYFMVAGYTGNGYGILLLNLGNGRMQLRVDSDGIKVKRATSANTWSNWTLIGT